jgi:acyl-CoA thioester hydrolase
VTGFTLPVRVYWEDTDAGGVVYYANYFRFMERARTEFLRALGFDQLAMVRDPGIVFVVVEATAKFQRPARMDDALTVTVTVLEHGATTIEFEQRVLRDAETLVTGRIRAACVDAASFRPRRIPEPILEALAR